METQSGDTENGLGERVVFELTECLRGGNYHIYCDNYFTTCRLLDTLLTHKIYGCGTARTARREFPETLKQVRLERGAHLFCQRGSLVASVWMDKKPVTMLSTLAQADATHTAQRRQRDGLRVSVQCPDAVVLYNQYMAGVDKGDQYRQYYRVRTKCIKNYNYFLFDVAITNSYILSTFTPTCAPVSHQRLRVRNLQSSWLADTTLARNWVVLVPLSVSNQSHGHLQSHNPLQLLVQHQLAQCSIFHHAYREGEGEGYDTGLLGVRDFRISVISN